MTETINALAAERDLAETLPMTLPEIYEAIDVDGSGSVNFREFAEWWARRQTSTKGKIDEDVLQVAWTLFEKHDSDDDQELSQQEFVAALEELAHSEWREAKDPHSGRPYWVNPKTRASRWDKPSIKDFLFDNGIADLQKKKKKMRDKVMNDSGDNMTMLVNMWKLYLKTESTARRKFYSSFVVYIMYMVLMTVLVFGMLPLSSSLLLHQEALVDLFLDEEFGSVANHKKSWFDVMTEPELWEWVEEPLYGAFYGDNTPLSACGYRGPLQAGTTMGALDTAGEPLDSETSYPGYPKCDGDLPGSVLHMNKPLGRVQIRTLRVKPHKCADVAWTRTLTTSTLAEPITQKECEGRGEGELAGIWQATDARYGVEGLTEAQSGSCLTRPDWVNDCAGAWSGDDRDATPEYYESLRVLEAAAEAEDSKKEPGKSCTLSEECRSGKCGTTGAESGPGICTSYDDPTQLQWFRHYGTSYLKNCPEDAMLRSDCDTESDGGIGTSSVSAANAGAPGALVDFRRAPETQTDTAQEDSDTLDNDLLSYYQNMTQWAMSSFGYSTLRGHPGMVANLIGYTGNRDHRYGGFGYAVTLPQDRQGFRATVCKLRGMLEMCNNGNGSCFVKQWQDPEDMTPENAWSGLSVTPADQFPQAVQDACPGIDEGSCQCVDDPFGVPFIDRYTRAISIGFALWNGNDFDIDDPEEEPYDAPELTNRLDDQYVAFSVQIAVSAGGQFEKYDRVNIIRPMRTLAYLDSATMQGYGVAFCLVVAVMFFQETRAVQRNGLKSHFWTSKNSFWNKYEFVFYGCVLNALRSLQIYANSTQRMEADLAKLAHAGLVEHTFVDMIEFKKDFRKTLQYASFVVLVSIFKVFKYLELFSGLSFMTRIILKAKGELFSFIIVFMIIIVCFAYLGCVVVGYEDRLFHNLATSLFSLLRLSVGALDFDYSKMKTADAFWAPIFLTSFIFVGMLVSINIFIAILSEYYERIKSEDRQWAGDVEIFKRQGFSVPSNALLDRVTNVRDFFHITSQLMREDEPPGLPVRVLPVHKIVARIGDFDGFSADDVGSNMFTRNLGTAIIGGVFILGLCIDTLLWPQETLLGSQMLSYTFYLLVALILSSCVTVAGACKKAKVKEKPENWTPVYEDRIRQLAEEFNGPDGPNEDRFASNLVRLHYYSEFVPDELRSESKRQRNIPIRGVIEQTDRGPMLRSADSFMSGSDESPMNRMIMSLGMVREDDDDETGDDDRTVVCLRLHADDMYSEVRPQVLSKMKARFPLIKDGTREAPFGDENLTPDTVTLTEDEFGAKFEMELLCHEVARNDANAVFGEQKDMFALFRVIEISSKEHFDGKATPLNLESGGWNDSMGEGKDNNPYYPTCSRDDGVLWDMIVGKAPHMSNSAMAEKFSKSEREVELRQRFLKRQCKDAQGYPITPKLLTITFQPSWDVAYRMWMSALNDKGIGSVSCGFLVNSFCKTFKFTRDKDPIIRDMKKFLRVRIQEIRDNSNTNDLPELERTFLAENMEIEDAIGSMRVYCINSGRRDAAAMEKYYGRPGEEKLVHSKYGDSNSEMIDVRAKIKNWLVKKHSSELDCVIEKAVDSDSDSEDDDPGLQQFQMQQQLAMQRQIQLRRAAESKGEYL